MKILSRSEDVQELLERIRQEDCKIYIYGARNAARRFYLELQYEELSRYVEGFLVSSIENNPVMIEKKNVYAVTDMSLDEKAIVVVTAEKRHLSDIEKLLLRKGFTNIYYPEEQAMLPLYRYSSKGMVEYFTKGNYILRDNEVDSTYMKLSLKGKEDQYYMLSPYFGIPYNDKMRKFFEEYDFEKEYYDIFGGYTHLSGIESGGVTENTDRIKIYMVTSHMNQAKWDKEQPEHLIPIQAGAALTKEKYCKVTDNTGDNISERNQTLGEMTATYWVWKNSQSSSYKGICHYRRHFQITKKEYQAIIASDMDAVMCVPRFVLPGNIENLIRMNLVDDEAASELLQIIGRKAPEYYECTKKHFTQNMFYPCNMLIAKEQVFNEYCEFMFPILLDIDDYINKKGLKTKARCAAYLAELLTSVYFVYHKDNFKLAIADYQLVE